MRAPYLLLLSLTAAATAQDTLVLSGGHLFDGVADERVDNPGILIRGGKILAIGNIGEVELAVAQVLKLPDDATVLPGFFDLHAHHAVDFFGRGRVDETEFYPRIFLANGVTSVFPAGEMEPEKMAAMRRRIHESELPGPRVFNSGPYFGSARPGWNRNLSAADLRAEVDHWAAEGARAFKAKGITPEHLEVLVERAHHHGLTVTGHLGSGFRSTVNPKDAILMGIDRVEHFLGGDGLSADKSAYASLVDVTTDTPAFREITAMFIEHGVFFDATISAYGYFGEQDPEVFTKWVDEQKYLTPFLRDRLAAREPRRVNQSFERIYRVKHKTIKAFYDAGGGPWITLGTDHPSWGDFLSGFSVHRELHCLVRAGIPEYAALRIATHNGARALGMGDKLGTVQAGKYADLTIVRGNPLADITATHNVWRVVKAGVVYDPVQLLAAAEGKIGPQSEDEITDWIGRFRRRR